MGRRDGPSAAEWTRAGVELIGIIVAGVLFFSTEEPVLATLLLAAALVVGDLGGRMAANWVAKRR